MIRFPFTACEILTSEVPHLQDLFFGKKSHIKHESKEPENESGSNHKEPTDEPDAEEKDNGVKISTNIIEITAENQHLTTTQNSRVAHYFFSFLNNDTLKDTLVGYFAKVLGHILLRQQDETLDFLYENTEYIEKLIKHIDHRAIAECIQKIVAFRSPEIKYMEKRRDILIKLILKLVDQTGPNPSDATENACFILSEIFTKNNVISAGKHLVDLLTCRMSCEVMFMALFFDASKIKPVGSLLITIINYYSKLLNPQPIEENHEDDSETQARTINAPLPNLEAESFFELLAKNIEKLTEYIGGSEHNEIKSIETQFGKSIKPFGTIRLKLIELLFYAVRINNAQVNQRVAASKVFSKLQQLITEYEWNNILHSFVEKIFICVIEGSSAVLKKALIEDANLLCFLKNISAQPTVALGINDQGNVRKSYLAQITRIALALQKRSAEDEIIKAALERQEWKDFEQGYLTDTLKKDNHDLACAAQKKNSDDDFAEDRERFSSENLGKLSTFTIKSNTEGEPVPEDIEDNLFKSWDAAGNKFDNIFDNKEKHTDSHGSEFVVNNKAASDFDSIFDVKKSDEIANGAKNTGFINDDWFNKLQDYTLDGNKEGATDNWFNKPQQDNTNSNSKDFWSADSWATEKVTSEPQNTAHIDPSDPLIAKQNQHPINDSSNTEVSNANPSVEPQENDTDDKNPNKAIESWTTQIMSSESQDTAHSDPINPPNIQQNECPINDADLSAKLKEDATTNDPNKPEEAWITNTVNSKPNNVAHSDSSNLSTTQKSEGSINNANNTQPIKTNLISKPQEDTTSTNNVNKPAGAQEIQKASSETQKNASSNTIDSPNMQKIQSPTKNTSNTESNNINLSNKSKEIMTNNSNSSKPQEQTTINRASTGSIADPRGVQTMTPQSQVRSPSNTNDLNAVKTTGTAINNVNNTKLTTDNAVNKPKESTLSSNKDSFLSGWLDKPHEQDSKNISSTGSLDFLSKDSWRAQPVNPQPQTRSPSNTTDLFGVRKNTETTNNANSLGFTNESWSNKPQGYTTKPNQLQEQVAKSNTNSGSLEFFSTDSWMTQPAKSQEQKTVSSDAWDLLDGSISGKAPNTVNNSGFTNDDWFNKPQPYSNDLNKFNKPQESVVKGSASAGALDFFSSDSRGTQPVRSQPQKTASLNTVNLLDDHEESGKATNNTKTNGNTNDDWFNKPQQYSNSSAKADFTDWSSKSQPHKNTNASGLDLLSVDPWAKKVAEPQNKATSNNIDLLNSWGESTQNQTLQQKQTNSFADPWKGFNTTDSNKSKQVNLLDL